MREALKKIPPKAPPTQLHVDDNRFHRGGTWGQENLKEALDCQSGQPRTFCKMDIVLDGIILLIRPIFKTEVAITCIQMGVVTNGGRRRRHMRFASGVAALNVGGRTIHSLFSLSLDVDWQIKEGTILWWMSRNADMIIVDEFSLLLNKLLHTLNDILHKVRRDKRNPFGGITMLLVGYPLQLLAVDLDIFNSALFRNHFVPVVLTEVMRQDDGQFIDLLNRVRIGEETDDDHLTLQQRIAPNNDVSLQDLEDAPMLVGANAMHRWNEHFMAQLGSNIVTFNATYVDMGGAPTNQAICDYINSRNRRVLPQQVFVAASMRARLIHNGSIQNRLVNSTVVVIK